MSFGQGGAEYTLATRVTSSGFGGLQDKLTGATGALSSFQKSVGLAGGALAALSAGALAKATQSAIRFESQLADLEKVTSSDMVEPLKQGIMDLSERIPMARKGLTELAVQAGKFGAESEEEILAFTESVGKIASATSLAADEAGTRFAKIAGAIGMPMAEIDKLGNAVNSLSDSMKTDAGEITNTATRASNVLSQQLGLGQDSVLALSASMNEVSATSRLAASSLRRMAETMMDPRKMGDMATAVGLAKDEFKAMVKQEPEKLMQRLADTMRENGKGADILRSSIGKAANDFTKLATQSDQTASAQKLVNQQFKNGTSLSREMGIRTETAAGKWQLLTNKLQNAATRIGDRVLPYVKGLLDVVIRGVDWFGQLNKATDGLAGTLTLVGGVVVGTVAAIGSLVSAVGASSVAMAGLSGAVGALGTAFTVLTGPIGIAVAAIAALSYAVSRNFGQIKATARAALTAVGEELRATRAALAELGGAVMWAIQPAINAFAAFERSVNQTTDGIVGDVQGPLVGGIRAAGDAIRSVIYTLTAIVGNRGSEIRATLRAVAGGVRDAFGGVADTIRGHLPRIRGALGRLGAAFGGVSDRAEVELAGIGPAVRRAIGRAQATIQRRLPALRSSVDSELGALEGVWQQHGGQVRQTVRETFQFVKTHPVQSVSILATRLLGPLGVVLSGVRQNLGLIKREFRLTFGALQTTVTSSMQTIQRQLIDPLTNAESRTRGTLQSIRTEFIQTFGVILLEARESFTLLLTEVRETWTIISSIIRRVTAVIMKNVGPFLRNLLAIWREHFGGANGLVANTRSALNTIWTIVKPFLDILQSAFKVALDAIQVIFKVTMNTIQAAWKLFGDDLIMVLDGALGTITTILEIAFDAILTTINVTLDLISGDWRGAWSTLAGFLERTWTRIANWLGSSGKKLFVGALGIVIKGIKAVFEGLYNWLIGGSIVKDIFQDIASYIRNDAASDLASAARNAAEGAANALKDAFNSALPDAINIPSVSIGGGSINLPSTNVMGRRIGGGSLNIPRRTVGGQSLQIPQLQTGGLIEDEGLAALHEGELVVPAAQVDRDVGGGGKNLTIHGGIEIHTDSDEPEDMADELVKKVHARF